MSFPSITGHLAAGKVGKDALRAAVLEDCPHAIAYLKARANEARANGEGVLWTEDPTSPLGKQLIRIHASDAVRPLVEAEIGQSLMFVNCCGGIVGGKKKNPDEIVRLQIECQAGPTAYADC